MTRDGRITDVKTIIGLNWAQQYLEGKLPQAKKGSALSRQPQQSRKQQKAREGREKILLEPQRAFSCLESFQAQAWLVHRRLRGLVGFDDAARVALKIEHAELVVAVG